MRGRLTGLALAALLPALALSASAAGGAEDPLITRSYLEDSFVPQTVQILRRTAEAFSWSAAAGPRLERLTLALGQSVSLSAGQQFIPLDGNLYLDTVTGTLIDVSHGRAEAEAVEAGCRYIVCEDGAVTLSALSACSLLCTPSAAVRSGGSPLLENPFTDVAAGSWYYADVLAAWRRGLVNGMTASSFVPGGSLTAVQCVKLAACVHQLRYTGSVTLQNSAAGPWHQTYTDYALSNGIIDAAWGEEAITRGDFAAMLYRALPPEDLPPINNVPDGAVPDVYPEQTPHWAEIYALYRAGVLTGYAADGVHQARAFAPESTITRAEVAVILNRMLDAGARVLFEIAP